MKYKNAKNLTTCSCLTNYAITFKGNLVVLTLSRKATKISQCHDLLKIFSNDMLISSTDILISTDSIQFHFKLRYVINREVTNLSIQNEIH